MSIGYREAMEAKTRERREAESSEFSAHAQPKAEMKITTTERVQPCVAGKNEKGEIVWEGRAMSLWQRLMFPLTYIGDFKAFWIKRKFFVETGIESDNPECVSAVFHAAIHSNQELEKKYKRRTITHKGD